MGSTRVLTDEMDKVTDRYNYDASGDLLNKTTINNYLYTGEQYAPNLGLYYLRARYMDPNIGRFVTTMDTWEVNRYNPVTLVHIWNQEVLWR